MTRDSVNKGRQLKFAREYRGFSVREVCEKTNTSATEYTRLELGFETKVTDNHIEDIMEFLNWPLSWLKKRAIDIESINL